MIIINNIKRFSPLDKREKAKENITNFIRGEFEDSNITYIFIITLLKENIKDIEAEALDQKY